MDKNEYLLNKRAKAQEGGGEKRLEKQHAQGKLSARERIAVLWILILSMKLEA